MMFGAEGFKYDMSTCMFLKSTLVLLIRGERGSLNSDAR